MRITSGVNRTWQLLDQHDSRHDEESLLTGPVGREPITVEEVIDEMYGDESLAKPSLEVHDCVLPLASLDASGLIRPRAELRAAGPRPPARLQRAAQWCYLVNVAHVTKALQRMRRDERQNHWAPIRIGS